MNLFVDFHTLIWSYFTPTRLSSTAQNLLADSNHRVYVSAASHWEIAIKISTGKLKLAELFPDFLQHAVFDNGYSILGIEPRHTTALITLPYHHRDPFDRMIIAQSIVEDIPIVSVDPVFDAYPIRRIW